MAAFFSDLSVLHDQNAVSIGNGRKTMRDHKRRSAFRQFGKRLLNSAFSFGIQRRGCFVEYKYWGILQKDASDSEALLLPA